MLEEKAKKTTANGGCTKGKLKYTEISKKTQSALGWNDTDLCTNCVYTTLPPEMGARFRFLASQSSLPVAWLALLITKAGDVESNPVPTTHTNTLHSYGFVTSVTNK